MKNHFEDQMKARKKITAYLLPRLNGRSMYGEYQVGDTILYFMDQQDEDTFRVDTVTDRDLEHFYKDYEFIRMGLDFPIFKRIKK